MRIVAHLDMDAFFAAVEERDTPCFSGLPIVIGADPQKGKGRGVVSTANYKSREYGIHSALPISKAWQFSQWAKQRGEPEAIFIEPDMEKYERTSDRIVGIVKSVLNEKFHILPERVCQSANESKATRKTLRQAQGISLETLRPALRQRLRQGEQAQGIRNYKIEPASIDEMYLDLSFTKSFKKAKELCQKIKNEIKKKEKLTCSIGIGPNKLIAKIASDMQKPDGLTIVEPEKVEDFLSPLPIRKIPGIGPKAEIKLHGLGVILVKDLKSVPLEKLQKQFGKWGVDMFNKARGIDGSPIEEIYEIKSISEQETFPKDTLEANFIIDRLDTMCQNIINRLIAENFKNFRTIVLTVRFTGFITKTRSYTLKKPTNSFLELKREIIKLLMPFLDKRENPKMKKIRLIGVRIEKLG